MTDEKAKFLTAHKRLVISIIGDKDDVRENAKRLIAADPRLSSRKGKGIVAEPVLNDDQGRYIEVLVIEDRDIEAERGSLS